jgi:hypothetical protein
MMTQILSRSCKWERRWKTVSTRGRTQDLAARQNFAKAWWNDGSLSHLRWYVFSFLSGNCRGCIGSSIVKWNQNNPTCSFATVSAAIDFTRRTTDSACVDFSRGTALALCIDGATRATSSKRGHLTQRTAKARRFIRAVPCRRRTATRTERAGAASNETRITPKGTSNGVRSHGIIL